jgi:hypothetical protein
VVFPKGSEIKLIEKLPEQDRSVVKIFLDAFITKGKIKQLMIKKNRITSGFFIASFCFCVSKVEEQTTCPLHGELNEQLALINQLDEDEKNALVKIINSMLTKKRMKDLFDGKFSFTQ